jgi:LysM repeat protein
VQRGDTLEGIADRFDVTVSDLKRWNHIASNHAARGSRLKIFTGSESAEISAAASSRSTAHTSRAAERTVSTRSADKLDAVQHKVKPGETLYSIAREYGTTVSALKESNPFLADRSLEAGDLLKVQR